jgi:hypothetical protein
MKSRVLLALAPAALFVGCISAPTITSVRVSRTNLLSSQTSRINLTINDDNGLDNVVGAHLYSGDGNYWFGAFAEVSDGVFEYVIDWGQLNEQQPIYFDFPTARDLLVIVEDNDGESDRVVVSLTLSCRAAEHACDGACYPIDLDCADI